MRNGYPQVKRETGLTDYTVAGTVEGRHSAALLRIAYEAKVEYHRTCRSMRLDGRFWDTRLRPHPVKLRRGYPTKRERNEDIPSKRNVPHSNFLNRFKIVEKTIHQMGKLVHTAKVYVLHTTRGWKFYA